MTKIFFIIILLILAIFANQIFNGSLYFYPKHSKESVKSESSKRTTHNTITFNPSSLSINEFNKTYQANLNLTTNDYPTLIQLEIGYDPSIIEDIKLSPGQKNLIPILSLNDTKNGRLSYAYEISSAAYSIQITLNFTIKPNHYKNQTRVILFPKTSLSKNQIPLRLNIQNSLYIFINNLSKTPLSQSIHYQPDQ